MAEEEKRTSRTTFILLFAGLVIWAAVIAIGVLRQPEVDSRKAMFVVAAVAVFVLSWIVALWRRGQN